MSTVLAAGDIAIVSYNSDDPDTFAFVFLRDVEAGTTINFTDNGWKAAGGFHAGEGTATYTAPTDIVAGTVVSVPLGTMGLSFLGDQIIAYQGTEASPTFLYAIDFADGNSAFAADATSILTTALPPSLALGVTAIALPFDNAVYTGPTSGFASPLDVLEAIGDTANWTGSDADPLLLPPTAGIFLIPGGPGLDLDFDNSTSGGRDYRTSYNQGGTTVGISDVDVQVFDGDGNLASAEIRVRFPQPDYLLSVNGILPPTIEASDYNPVTGVLRLFGAASLTAYETAIGLIVFSSTSAAIGDLIRVDVTVNDSVFDSPVGTAFIRITGLLGVPINAPLLDLDANNSNGGGADYTATFVDGGPAIPIADIDVNITDLDGALLQSARIFIGINRDAADELLFTGAPGGPISTTGYNPVTGVLTLTGLATLDAYEAALRQVVYRSNSSTPPIGDRIIEVTVNDGTADSNIARTFMHVVDVVAVAPTLDLDVDNSTTTGANYLTGYTQGAPAVAIADTDVDISDADSTNVVSATITLTNPQVGDVLSLGSGFPPGITASPYDPATGTLTLTGPALLATYETALQNIVFSNVTTLSTATRTIEIVVNDGVVNSNIATALVQVEAVPDPIAPVLDLDPDDSGGSLRTTFRTTFTEGLAAVPIADTDTSIIDTDSPQLASATITLMNHQAGDLLTAAALLPGAIVASLYDPLTGILTLTGPATPDQYEAALQQIFYSNGGDDPVTLDRLIEVVVNDGVNDSNVAAALIGVVAVNDAPTVTVDATATYIENAAALPLSPLATLADLDDAEFTGAVVIVTGGSFPGDGDVLTLNGATSGVVDGVTFEWLPAEHALTFTGASSGAVYQELLRNVEFRSSSDNPTDFGASPTRSLSWTVSDGTTATTATSVLSITASNDAPDATVAATATYTENAPPVIISPAATVSDVDDFNLTAGLVEIVSGELAGDILTVNGLQSGTFAGIDFSFVAGVGLSFHLASPVGDYQTFLQAVQFQSTSENPTNSGLNPTRTLSWTVSDGRESSAAETTTITIVPLNDGPVAVDDGPVTTAEDTLLSNIVVLANDTDVDLDTLTIFGTPTALHGIVTVNADGTLNYMPAADYNGADTITYLVTDGLLTDTGEVSVTITAVADIAGDTATTAEDTAVITSVLANDGFEGTAAVTAVTQGANGTVVNNNDGTVTYTPNADFNGIDSYTYEVTSGGVTETATVNVTVTAVADIAGDTATTAEDTAVITSVLANDGFEGTAAVTAVTQGANGTVVNNNDGTVTYTPNADFNGIDSYTYEVTSGGVTETATVNVTVTAVADIAGDTATTAEDTAVITSVLANDGFEGTAAVTAVTQGANGTVVNNNDGTVTYTPNADFNGIDSYTYEVTSGGVTETATVNVTVTAVADIAGDTATTAEDTAVITSVLANDGFEGTAAVTAVTQGANGTVVNNNDGTVTYTPNADFNGIDSYTYEVTSGGVTETATVNVTVTAVADIAGDTATTAEDTAVITSVLANDGFEGTAAVTAVTQGANGTVVNNNDGTVTYTPNADFNGIDSYTYEVTSGGVTETATVNVTVTAVADIAGDTATTAEDTAVITSVLANDGFEGTAAVTAVTQGANGTVVNNNDGTVTYTPNADFNGIDSYTYEVTSGGVTETATVNVTVTAVADIAGDTATTAEDTAVITSVLANDGFEGTAAVTAVTQGANGTVVNNNDGTVTYTPNADFNGIDSYTYEVTSGGVTETATVNVTVTAVADIAGDTATTAEDTAVITSVLANDGFEGTAAVTAVTQGANGTVVNNNDGTVTYTPNADFNGIDSYTYEVTSGGVTETATVNVTVTAVADIAGDTATTAEDTAVITSVLANDGFEGTAAVTAVTQGANGTVVNNNDGTVTYTPNADFNGIDSYTYEVTSGGVTETATVNVTVTAVADIAGDTATTAEDTAVITSVLANDGFEGTAAVTAVTQGANGTVVNNNDGTVTYTPNADFNGIDSYTYEVTSGGVTETATVNVTVNEVNDDPVAGDDAASGDEDTTITTGSVLANDDDVDSTLTAASISGFTHGTNGTVVNNGDGTFDYTPDADFSGVDTFTYTIDDGDGGTDTATVTVTVNGVNDDPIAADDAASGDEDTTITTGNVLANDDDVDSTLTPASISGFSQGTNGTVVNNGDGTFDYTPNPDFNGSDSFTYTIDDGDGGIATATVNVTVNEVDEPLPPDPSATLLDDVLWQHDDGTVRTANGILGSLPDTSRIGATGDFDGDGDSDVVWHDSNQQVAVWEVQDGSLVQTHDLPTEPTNWQIVGSGDFDGDGDDDIVWRLDEGEVVTWEVEGGNFVDHHHLPVDDHNQNSITPTNWRFEGTGDFDGDGDDDLVWHHEDGLVTTWEMEDGAYVVNHNLPDASSNWQIDGTGDFDGDGDDDILWRHDEGLVVTWEMEDGAYVVNHNLATVPTNWQIAGTADFNDDGTSDILWRHDDGTVVTWEMENGQVARTQDFGVVDNAWHIRGTGEFPLV